MKNLPVEMTEIRSCMKFFDFLQERHGERYTKFEADCYLLNKACVQYIPENFPKDQRPHLAEYQFITTKTELSEVWHWHRATVRSFLDKLVECGQLIRKDYAKSIFCTMTALSSPASTHDLQKICDEYNCLCGKPATGVDTKESAVSSSVSRK